MNYILFDTEARISLLPFTYTRPISEIRVGILTITEKWNKYLNTNCSFLTEKYLKAKYSQKLENDNCYINASVIPNQQLIDGLDKLKKSEALYIANTLIAFRCEKEVSDLKVIESKFARINDNIKINTINNTWDIFALNEAEIKNDYKLITKGRVSQKLPDTCRIIGDNIFVEEGVKADFATINAKDSCVYLGKDSELMDGALIKGSFALCEHSVVKLGAKIYGATTIGPYSKVGGEISNSVIIGYSNKGHDGFLGNSVLGEWCNLGADTNTSNLKNNYSEVKLWDYQTRKLKKTGQQFCGLMMGDHSKCGINTMFNTGTVAGVCANIFGAGFPRTFIPSFSWGGAHGFVEYRLEKVFEVNEIVMKRRNKEFTKADKEILEHIFEISKEFRVE